MQLTAFVSLVAVAVTALLGCVSASDAELLAKVCPTALAMGDPHCHHGGSLYGKNLSDYLNCASCECPSEWSGVDCRLCTSTESCPEKDGKQALECTHDKVALTDEEYALGKELSCYCGGIDPTTEYVCNQQPGTNWQIVISPSDATGSFNMTVLERAGVPSQDYYPTCKGHRKDVCPTQERYRYAAPQVWEGKLSNCYWEKGECILPLKGNDCVLYKCQDLSIECPPSYVEKCPGWTPFECDNPPGEDMPYWMHRCNPIALPYTELPLTVGCKPEKDNGLFQCYLSQEGSYFSSLGMQCETGTCVYEDLAPVHHHHRRGDKGVLHWLDENQADLVTGLMWFCLILVLVIVMVCIRRDKRRSLKRAEEWARGHDRRDGYTALTPLLHASESFLEEFVATRPLVMHFQDIEYYVKMRGGKIKHVLCNVHGVAAPHEQTHQGRVGSMLAIMGPSGAGKTSLMDILSGYRRVGVAGTVHVNGMTLTAGNAMMRRVAGYVQQDDVLPGTSTVFEYLLFNAALRMPKEVTRHQKEKRVFSVLQELGLTKVAHNFVGDQFTRGLSGGEKRRVSIACELLVGPRLVFLDEPTTGLDSTNASKVVEILSAMAAAGVAVVMTIHQPRPDLFRILDRSMLLSGDGQVVYSGPASEAEAYFGTLGYTSPLRTVHIMDHMLDVVIKLDASNVDDLVEKFATSTLKASEVDYVNGLVWSAADAPTLKFRSSFFQQVRCLSTRLMRNTSRHPFLITLNFVATFAVAVVLGLLFHNTGKNTDGIQSRLGVLFFIVMFLSTMSLSSIPVWREERLLFKRERGNGVYGASAYFLSVLLFDLIPLRVLPPMFFSIISYWMMDLHVGCALCIVWFTLISVLTNVVAALTSMTVGAATPTNAVANAFGSLCVLVFLLFAGYFLNKDEMPKWCKAFSLISYLNYGYAGLVINEFLDAPGEFVFTALIDSDDFVPLRIKGSMVLCEFGFDDGLFAFDVTMLFVIGGICCGITYLILLVSGWDLSPSLDLKKIRLQEEKQKENGVHEPLIPSIGGPSASLVPFLQDGVDKSENAPVDGTSQFQEIPYSFHLPALQGNGMANGNGIEHLTLSWHNITCIVSSTLLQNERTILRNISGVAGPIPIAPTSQQASAPLDLSRRSVLFAIMGPSGAGKTTLIDILAGRKRDVGVTEDIRINGRPATASITRKLAGYVLQENVLPATPTVFEHVMFHAQLRIRLKGYSAEETKRVLTERVLGVCRKLGLEKVLESRIGDAHIRGLSGGERRRVSIACELLVGPGIMFLDEPTTGLDSTNATQVVDILSEMATSGVTVIMSIHQPRPSFFNLMDKIMMLSGDGQVVFTGCSSTAKKHFESLGHVPGNETVDISDFMLDLVIKSEPETVQGIVDRYQKSDACREDELWMQGVSHAGMSSAEHAAWMQFLHSHVKYQASHWTQIKVLSLRMGRNLYRHPLLLFVNFLSAFFVSLMLGTVYWDIGVNTAGIQNRLGALFFIITYLCLMSLSSLPLWHDDRLLFVRERAAGAYGTTSYFVANVLFDILPMRVLPPCFFALFSYWMIGFNGSAIAVVRFLLVIILCNIASSTFSLAIGATLDSTSMANMVASLLLLMANLLGGFFLSRKRLFSGLDKIVDILSKLSYVRYAFEALLLNEFHGEGGFALTASYRCIPADRQKGTGFGVDGDEVLRTFGFPTSWSNFVVDIVALLCFIFVHSLVIFLLFKFRDRPGEPPIWNRIVHKAKKWIVGRGVRPSTNAQSSTPELHAAATAAAAAAAAESHDSPILV